MMEVGSRAGYYTSKSPKMILHEWCNRANRPKPRYKPIAMEDGQFRCKVLTMLQPVVASQLHPHSDSPAQARNSNGMRAV